MVTTSIGLSADRVARERRAHDLVVAEFSATASTPRCCDDSAWCIANAKRPEPELVAQAPRVDQIPLRDQTLEREARAQ